jgi:hypothetical protein
MIFLRDTKTQQSSSFLFTVLMERTSNLQTMQRPGKHIMIYDHAVSFILIQKDKGGGVGEGRSESDKELYRAFWLARYGLPRGM